MKFQPIAIGWNFLWFYVERWVEGQKHSCTVGVLDGRTTEYIIELVSKELNQLAAILHVYAGGLNFIK